MKQARDPSALRAAVATRDLTHRELARLAETTHGMIGFVLAGARCDDAIARRIARALRRNVSELFVTSESNSEQRPVPERAAG